ncbi:Multidrug export protein MepA [Sporomusa rhizae]|uniref:MATE family efflux transporter n=1 Tax=Sporomusa rhizae TaxID=357999 RepID=UPI00352AE5C4
MNKIQELEHKPIGKLIVQYSLPAMLSLLVNSLYIFVDRIFIGNIPEVGAFGLTGIGLTMPIITVIVALSALISMGASSNISIKLGEGKKGEAEIATGNAITLCVFIGITITILYLIFQNQILDWLGLHGQTLLYTKGFITIIMFGTVFNMLSFAFPFLVRADGNPSISAGINITGCILNIGLDALFINVFNMGIVGAGMATVIAQFITVILGFSYFLTGKSTLNLAKNNLVLCPSMVKAIALIGLVPCSNQLSISIAQIVSNYSLNLYGGEMAIGAMTVINSIASVFLMPVYGIAQGFQPIIGFNYAKLQYDRAMKTLALATIYSAIILTAGTVITLIFPVSVVGLFTHESELVNISVSGIGKYMVLLPLATIPTFGSGFMMLTGKPKTAVLVNVLRQSVILATTIFLLPKAIGQDGLWFAQPITDLLASVMTILLFINGYWHVLRRKPH